MKWVRGLVLLGAAAIAAPSAPVRAQPPASQSPGTFAGSLPATLTSALKTLPLDWDAREKGVLLWVGIAPEAEPLRLSRRPGFMQKLSEPLPPASNGSYRLPDIAARFDRRIVRAGKVTVLAPTETTVLATRLPVPDVYAGLSFAEKMSRLQKTLSQAQWQRITSPQGLGIGDLKNNQRAIFAALLPDPLIVTRTVSQKDRMVHINSAPPISLTPAQRTNVRLIFYRTLSWSFTTAGSNSGEVSIGSNPAAEPEGTETLTLVNSYPSPFDPDATLFGVKVKSVVPAFAKPSDIDYANSALDKTVICSQEQTVGELINLIKEKTGASLFCDIRYQNLPVYTRGGEQAARAGDALQAIALAVSGTYRKVSGTGSRAAYVLTDDLEGLGTRQARIAEWAQAAYAQKAADDAKEEAATPKNFTQTVGDYVGWRNGDAGAATGALAQKIDDYRTGKLASATVDGKTDEKSRGAHGLWVSVEDLPAPSQKAIAQSIADWNERLKQSAQTNAQRNDPFTGRPNVFDLPLREDKVLLQVQTSMGFLIDGLGFVEAQNRGDYDSRRSLLPPSRVAGIVSPSFPPVAVRRPAPAKPAPQAKAFALNAVPGAVHALLVALPQTEEGVQKAVSAAKAHGFNQLWVEMPVDTDNAAKSLQSVIAAAEAGGLRVQAVVRVLRRSSKNETDLPRDVNILGETLTQWAERIVSTGRDTAPTNDFGWAHVREAVVLTAQKQKRQGDFLDTAVPAVEDAIVSQLKTLAQTPHLAGIVVRDFAAPGSEGSPLTRYPNEAQSAAGNFGYTEARRFAFLQQTGVDPVDLSPLTGGRLTFGGFAMQANLQLPQFADYGRGGSSFSINGASGDTLGAKKTGEVWDTFRRNEADLFWRRLQTQYRTAAPDVFLLGQNTDNGDGPASLFWAGVWDKPAPVPDTPKKQDSNAATNKVNNTTLLQQAQQKSSHPVLIFRYDPTLKSIFGGIIVNSSKKPEAEGPEAAARKFSQTLEAYLASHQEGWDGLVIDLSTMPLDDALPLLSGLPQGTNAPVPVQKVVP